MEYVHTGLTHRFINYYIALWRVSQEQKPTTRHRYGSGTLHPGQLLVVTTLAARFLYDCKVAREPSGKR